MNLLHFFIIGSIVGILCGFLPLTLRTKILLACVLSIAVAAAFCFFEVWKPVADCVAFPPLGLPADLAAFLQVQCENQKWFLEHNPPRTIEVVQTNAVGAVLSRQGVTLSWTPETPAFHPKLSLVGEFSQDGGKSWHPVTAPLPITNFLPQMDTDEHRF